MIKLYLLAMVIYAVIKALNTKEVEPIRIAGETIKNLLLFPYLAIKDLVEWINKEPEEETTKRDR